MGDQLPVNVRLVQLIISGMSPLIKVSLYQMDSGLLPSEKGRRVWNSLLWYYKIEQQGAEIAEQLFCSLVSMFSLAPETIELTGQFQWENDTSGEYEKYVFDRDTLCLEIESFICLLRRVKNGEGYVLRYGI